MKFGRHFDRMRGDENIELIRGVPFTHVGVDEKVVKKEHFKE